MFLHLGLYTRRFYFQHSDPISIFGKYSNGVDYTDLVCQLKQVIFAPSLSSDQLSLREREEVDGEM